MKSLFAIGEQYNRKFNLNEFPVNTMSILNPIVKEFIYVDTKEFDIRIEVKNSNIYVFININNNLIFDSYFYSIILFYIYLSLYYETPDFGKVNSIDIDFNSKLFSDTMIIVEAFLIPEKKLFHVVSELKNDVLKISDYFGVTTNVIRKRCHMLDNNLKI